MTTAQKLIRNKLGLLELAAYLQNVSEACRVMGYSRDTFYRVRKAYEEGGLEAFQKTKGIGTPTFALGLSDPGTPDLVRVVKTFTGVGSYPGLRRKVQAVLSEGNPSQVR